MTKEPLTSDSRVYELALEDKQHHEDARDRINNYYIALFTAIIAFIPFLDKTAKEFTYGYEGYVLRIALTVLSIIGLVLAFTWAANLKRTLFYIQSLDRIMLELEKKHNQYFLTDIFHQLEQKHTPGRITRYQIVIPYAFIITFLAVLVYSLLWLLV